MNVEDLGDDVINIIKKEIKEPLNGWNVARIKSAFLELGLFAELIESIVNYDEISKKMKLLKI